MRTSRSLAETLYASYREWKVEEFTSRRFSPERMGEILTRIVDRKDRRFDQHEVGKSFEGRPIRLVTAGWGSTTALLWSQMHGDESTATMAIADILNYFRLYSEQEPASTILSSLRLFFLPMLNPDGAARFQRRTAQGIDMNRDALALQTPEAKILHKTREQYKPEFGFNLHDQELSTVGDAKELTAVAVLAPAFDEKKSENEVRRKAKLVAATMLGSLTTLIPGKLARYDDSFDPRAFGDAMQQWGTSTVLVEAGHMRNDPEKQLIRHVNAVGILTTLYALATGDYRSSDLRLYESLPFNSKRAYDIIIRDVSLIHKTGAITTTDLGISYHVDAHTEDTPVLVDIGDLRTYVGLRELHGRGTSIVFENLPLNKPFRWEQYFLSGS